MEVLNGQELRNAWRKHPQVRSWAKGWFHVASNARWHSVQEVRRDYPSADGVIVGKGKDKFVVTVFNAGGNDYRLLTVINYAAQRLSILSLLTHAEYDKEKWK